VSSTPGIPRRPRGAGLSRRGIVAGGLTLIAGAAAIRRALAADLAPTPRQSAGPFYPHRWRGEADADLVQLSGQPRPAHGQVAHVMGRILGRHGRPLGGVQVELWQCDALGRYHHPGEPRQGADPYFQGYGRMTVGADGAYHFRTLKPVPYPGRTPHIHFRLSGSGIAPMTTQMYLEGEPGNERDGLFGRLGAAERQRLLVALRPAPALEADALAGTFDIVLG